MINGRGESYVRAVIDGEVARVASASVGERNNTLFKATAALASIGLREGQIIHHLRPAAEGIGLHGKELYSTIKSGVKAGSSSPRSWETTTCSATQLIPRPKTSPTPDLPPRSSPDHESRPAFFHGGDEGPRQSNDEVRRHTYQRSGKPVRVKIKFSSGGFANWYRVIDQGREGWQSGKPDGYLPCPYVGALDPFDPELRGDVLYWPEGEKDCDTLGRLALPAFTFGGTGDGLPDGVIEYVRGRQLVILADNDPSGQDHAARKAALAHRVAASVKVLQFSELPLGGDVSDFLKHRTVEELEQRVAEAPVWAPVVSAGDASSCLKPGRALVTCALSDVVPEKVEWLWPGRVALGKLTMIAGEPGLGKSQLSIAIAATVTTGAPWPENDGHAPSGSVIILSAEDGIADTIRPRFDAAGGDPSRVTVIRAVQAAGAGGSGRQPFNLAADLALLEEEIKLRCDVRLVLIDPVSSYLGKIDSHKNTEVRSVLEPIGDMAERLRVAVLAITHLSKSDGKAINRVVGSIAFVAAARATFAVVADPDDEAGLRRLLLQVKNNIAPPQPGLAFRLVQQEVAPGVIGSAVAWDCSTPVTTTVDRALKGSATDEDRTAKDDAVEFLQEILASGPADVLDIEAEARAAAMLSETRRLKESKPFRAAADKLHVIKKRHGFGPGARVQWSLPRASSEGSVVS
jgi:RecA-family ATPase